MKDASEIIELVESEISRITQSELETAIRALLVTPRLEDRPWDYGPDKSYPCWIVAEHRMSNTALAYCEQGFGPISPWGLLFISGPHMSIGMDSGWFISLEECFRDSMAWEGANPPGYAAS